MTRTRFRARGRGAYALAVLAALLILPLGAAPPALADTPAAMLRSVLDEARREAAAMGRDVLLVQMSPDAAVQLNRRLDALERLIQSLTNKIDSLDAQQREMAREFERYKNDTDFRLGQMEKGVRAPQARPPERRTEAPPPARLPALRNGEDDAGPARPVRRSEEAARPGTDAGAQGSARDQYEHALGLLRRADYRAAEAALLDFVRRHPNDPLAANAYYWLGESYYAQGRFQDAAYQFADGFRKFPKHPKAQDSLFKLALAFARQGKTNEACASFGEFRKRYPNAGLRREAEAEQRRLKCPG